MASFDTTRPIAGGRLFGGRLGRVFAALNTWNKARVTRNALEKLSDRELDDIGLHRGDIDSIL